MTGLVGLIAFAIVLGLAMTMDRFGDSPRDDYRDEKETGKIRSKWAALVRDLQELKQEASMSQLESLVRKCDDINEVLDARFSENEMTANRYRLIVEEVRLGVLANLQRQVELVKASDRIDRDELQARIRKLEPGAASTLELEKALYDRLALVDSVNERIGMMSVSNEQAITALDKAIVELTGLDTTRADSGARFEVAVAELEQLVGRAHRLAARPDDLDIVDEVPKKKKAPRQTIKPGGS